MSTSLRSPTPAGARRPAAGSGRSTPPMQRPAVHDRQAGLPLDGISRHAEQEAPAVSPGRLGSRLFAMEPRLAEHGHSGQRELEVPGKHNMQLPSGRGTERPGGRPTVPESGLAAHLRHSCLTLDIPCGPGEHLGRALLATGSERLSRVRRARASSRFGHRRGVAGLVAVCVLALGVAACSVRDAKAEASASASASASAAIARAEKGIADANASATASREAALTPELRAKRDAALAEPTPAKPPQMNEESAEGAAASVGYFLNLYRYAFMTGNTTELAKMSEDGCKFCQSAISRATSLHATGGWIDKWEQDVTNVTYYEKLEGRDYNRVTVVVDYGPMTSHPGDGGAAKTSAPDEGRNLNFGVRYVNGRWSVGGVEVVK